MARDGSPAEDFPEKVMTGAAPCTCPKRCRSRSGSVAFLGLFLLSLCLHAVTIVFYMDLRSEVRRELIHQKRDSILTLAGSDPADPSVFAPGPPRLDPGSGGSRSGGDGHEVRRCKKVRHKLHVANLYSVLVLTGSCPLRPSDRDTRSCLSPQIQLQTRITCPRVCSFFTTGRAF